LSFGRFLIARPASLDLQPGGSNDAMEFIEHRFIERYRFLRTPPEAVHPRREPNNGFVTRDR
jgi:hypothetical protein